MNAEQIYSCFPISIQNALCSMEGWRIMRSRYDGNFNELLRAARERTWLSRDEIIAIRNRHLKEFIGWSSRTVPYYRNLFKKLGAHPGDFASLEDLSELPLLTKAQVQAQPKMFVSESIPRRDQVVCHTSGSTGAGLKFLSTRNSIQEQFAIYWRFLSWHGCNPGTWRAYFGGRSIVPARQKNPPHWRYNKPCKQILFSSYHLSERNMRYYVDELNGSQPSWLVGYPSSLALLANYLLQHGERLEFALSGIALSSENVMPHQIERMEGAFGVRPVQDYGQAEAVANFSECEHGCLHVDEDFSAVEFVPQADGDSTYRVVGTNFSNPATPLIRYDTGDIITANGYVCECGRPGRVVKTVDGRDEDYVLLKDGVRIGRLDHVFKDMVNIREAQIHQRRIGQMEVNVVKGTHYLPDDESSLLRELRKRVGDKTEIRITYVDRIKRTGRGKVRLVVSSID